MRRTLLSRIAAATVLVTALGACASTGSGGSSAPLPTGDALVAAAKAEGKVVVYTGWSQPTIPLVQKAFKDKYGIEVVIPERLSSAALGQRISADLRANGSVGADFVLTTDQALAATLRQEGHSRPVAPDQFPGLKSEFVVDDYAVECTVGVPVVGYNTDVLGGTKIDSWDDLMNPELKGKIMVADPRGSAAWASTWATLTADPTIGADFPAKIAAQDVQPVASSLVGTEQLGAGQGGVLLFGIPSLFEPAMKAGQPIDFWYPKNPSPVFYNFCLQPANSPHPNAGALFFQWMLSEEAQQLVQSRERQASPLGDLPGTIPLPENLAPIPDPAAVQQEVPGLLQRLQFR